MFNEQEHYNVVHITMWLLSTVYSSPVEVLFDIVFQFPYDCCHKTARKLEENPKEISFHEMYISQNVSDYMIYYC